MFNRQMPIGENVFGRLLEHSGGAHQPRAQAVNNLAELSHCRGVIRLRKDCADNRSDLFTRALYRVNLAERVGFVPDELV